MTKTRTPRTTSAVKVARPMAPRASQIRRPSQQRGKERYNAVVDAAERLLMHIHPDEISIYTIAEDAGMSPATIYHFFPDAEHVFIALTERYFPIFVEQFDTPPPEDITDWQALVDFRYAMPLQFYNENVAARRLLLGRGMASEMRAKDIELDQNVALRSVEELKRIFVMPEIPKLAERLTEAIVINDSLWALSIYLNGVITAEAAEQARRARLAYLRTFMPEYLQLREQDIENDLPPN
jgi:AcrR family transcriptional regulator